MFQINTNFSRALSLLRHEKGVSQRIAAQDLGVSQALLSHYENGIREPGLNFVRKACNYYNVSADFLLGRTLSRDGTVILDADTLSDDPKSSGSGDDLAQLSHRMVVNSANLLFRLLSATENKEAIRAACNYLGAGVYSLFRHLYEANEKNSLELFSVSSQRFALGAAKADMMTSEVEYAEALQKHPADKAELPDLSHEALTAQQPGLYQALLHIIHTTGERINQRLD